MSFTAVSNILDTHTDVEVPSAITISMDFTKFPFRLHLLKLVRN